MKQKTETIIIYTSLQQAYDQVVVKKKEKSK
jgi:hypothetical protein